MNLIYSYLHKDSCFSNMKKKIFLSALQLKQVIFFNGVFGTSGWEEERAEMVQNLPWRKLVFFPQSEKFFPLAFIWKNKLEGTDVLIILFRDTSTSVGRFQHEAQ